MAPGNYNAGAPHSRTGDAQRRVRQGSSGAAWLLLGGLALVPVTRVRPAAAGKGAVAARAGVPVSAPRQQVILAWNGKVEILILAADLRAAEPVGVLEVLPVPARPTVTRGTPNTYRKVAALVGRRLAARQPRDAGLPAAGQGWFPGARATVETTVEPRDLTSVEIPSASWFRHWVSRLLPGRRAPLPPGYGKAVEAYMAAGVHWFVFDSVDAAPGTRRIAPLEYRFSTTSLFFPHRFSSLRSGRTRVDLTVLTPALLTSFPELPVGRVAAAHLPIAIRPADLQEVHRGLRDLFKNHPRVYLRSWRLSGPTASLSRDLVGR